MKRYLRIFYKIRGRAARRAATALAAALLCALALPLVSLAARGTVEFEEGEGKALVSVALTGDEGARKGATSLELGLKISSGQLADLTVSFAFDGGLGRGRVAEFRYHPDTGILNLYVAGETPLFAGDPGTLVLGTVTVDGGTAGINVVENSLKLSGNALLTENVSLQPLAEDVPLDGGAADGMVDRSRLKEILQKAAEYKEADYTPESYQILAEAVKTAQAVLDKADASQTEIDEAVLLVENAIGSLVEKNTAAGGDGSSPGGGQNGGNSGSGNPNGGSSGSGNPNGGSSGSGNPNGGSSGSGNPNGGSSGSGNPNGGSSGSGSQNGGGQSSSSRPPLNTTEETDTGDKTRVFPYVLAASVSAAVIGGIVFLQRQRRAGRRRRPEK